MVVANSPAAETLAAVQPLVEREGTRLFGFLFWFLAIVLAVVVPLGLVMGAVFVSSWGIPLPIYVAIP